MIRKFDPALKEKLRIRAAHAGRSMEAELRSIVSTALSREPEPEENLAVAMRRLFGPLNGVDLELPPREPGREPPSFE
jgi:plasmid stability protein